MPKKQFRMHFKNNSVTLLCFLILLLLVLAWIDFFSSETLQAEKFKDEGKVLIHSKKGTIEYHVWIARTSVELQQGLMFRTELEKQRGMLFWFEKPKVVEMWMKNTKIPLDIFYIDENQTIVKIIEHAIPESTAFLSSDHVVKTVLEINAGLAKEYGITPGDKVSYVF